MALRAQAPAHHDQRCRARRGSRPDHAQALRGDLDLRAPEQVAAQLRPYADLGTRWMHLADTLPLVIDPEDGQNSVARTIEVARILKQNTGAAAEPPPAAAGEPSVTAAEA